MLRREFFYFTAGGIVATEPIADDRQLNDMLICLEKTIRAEIPDIKTIQITYNAADPQVPLMVMAFRF